MQVARLLPVLWLLHLCGCGDALTEAQVRDHILSGYNRQAPPQRPTLTKLELYFQSLSHIDQRKMEYDIDVYFRMRWKDERLAYGSMYSEAELVNVSTSKIVTVGDIWATDVYFPEAYGVTQPEELLYLSSDGSILWSRRLLMTMRCPSMHFGKYPFDVQTCHIPIWTYGDPASESLLGWTAKGAVVNEAGMKLGEWENLTMKFDAGTYKILSADYPYAQVSVEIHRIFNFGGHILPAWIFVAMSYCGYWINPAAAPGRIALAVLCVLITLSNKQSVQGTIPTVSYPVWLVDFMTECMLFNFTAIITYTLVNYGMQVQAAEDKKAAAAKQDKKDDNAKFGKSKTESEKKQKKYATIGEPGDVELSPTTEPEKAEDDTESGAATSLPGPKVTVLQTDWRSKLPMFSAAKLKDMDKAMRWMFPLTFLIYNIVALNRVASYE